MKLKFDGKDKLVITKTENDLWDVESEILLNLDWIDFFKTMLIDVSDFFRNYRQILSNESAVKGLESALMSYIIIKAL